MDSKDNLPATKNDCIAIRKAGRKYGFTDAGLGADMYIMEDQPTFNQFRLAKAEIQQRCKRNPDQGYIILSCFAGHGMLYEGKQVLLTNEFNPKKGFYNVI